MGRSMRGNIIDCFQVWTHQRMHNTIPIYIADMENTISSGGSFFRGQYRRMTYPAMASTANKITVGKESMAMGV